MKITNELIARYVRYTFKESSWNLIEDTPISVTISDSNGSELKILNLFNDIIIYVDNQVYCTLHEMVFDDGESLFVGGSSFLR